LQSENHWQPIGGMPPHTKFGKILVCGNGTE